MADWGMKFTVDGRSESTVSLAMQGRLVEVVDAKRAALERAYPRAMDRGVTKPGKQKLRATIEASGFYKAGSLAKTWRGVTYPSSAPTLEPTAFFASSAAEIIDAFEDGVTITAHNATWLAIPLGPAKAVVHTLNRASNRSRTASGKFADEAGTVDRVAAALGVTLVPIINHNTGKGVLVAATGDRFTQRGKRAKRQAGAATPLFALVKTATLKKRPMGREVLGQLQASFLGDFTAALAADPDASQ